MKVVEQYNTLDMLDYSSYDELSELYVISKSDNVYKEDSSWDVSDTDVTLVLGAHNGRTNDKMDYTDRINKACSHFSKAYSSIMLSDGGVERGITNIANRYNVDKKVLSRILGLKVEWK